MTDQTQLVKEIHDALTHLYDLPYLMSHPLVQAVATPGRAESPGRVLRRLLLDAIQELKPPAESPHDNVAASRYQFLHLRYVQGKTIEEMAKRLNLSERQLYRRQREALDAVAATVARQLYRSALDSSVAPGPSTSVTPAAADRVSPDTDIDRIGMAHASQPVDLLEVLAGIEETIVPLCQSAACGIRVKSELTSILVTVDRVALRQALLGLLTFAVGTAHPGMIEIAVSAEQGQVRVTVTIPTGGREIVRSFDDSNLAVCRRLIELQGGSVVPERDANLTIVVALPAFRRRTVLVVDDNADSRYLFTRYLEARGYHVLTADSGELALQMTLRERPDAILLDVMLPSSDGYEVLQALASDSAVGHTPILVCTVLKQRDLALALGASEFLAKPVTQGGLLDALDRCWGRSGSGRRC